MSNQQFFLAIGIPILFNGLAITILLGYISVRFSSLDKRFDQINWRFHDMRDLWRAEFHRVQDILDARLKHLEQSEAPAPRDWFRRGPAPSLAASDHLRSATGNSLEYRP